MDRIITFFKKHKRGFQCALVCALAFCVFAAVWFTEIRGQGEKSLSWAINDQFHEFAPIEQEVVQEFRSDRDLLAVSVVLSSVDPNAPPRGELELELADADSGEVLARSTGNLRFILEGKDGYYTTLGLDQLVPIPQPGQFTSYTLTIRPHYEGEGRISIGYEPKNMPGGIHLSVDGKSLTGTIALKAVQARIGGFLTRFYWVIAFASIALLGGSFWLFSSKKAALHQMFFCLVLVLGILFNLVMPPYSAPDERFHINQSFSLASTIYDSHLHVGRTNMIENLRRPSDQNALVQVDVPTVFTWKANSQWMTERNTDEWGKTAIYDEPQVESVYTLYWVSALGVLIGFVLRLGFVPTLYLGRLANLLFFAFFTSRAVKRTPIAKPVFAIAALLPMSLHLGASFSRDSGLLALCFYFVALVLDLAYGPKDKFQWKPILLMTVLGAIIAPSKIVYFPILALIFLIPRHRMGPRPNLLRIGILALCLLVFLSNSSATAIVEGLASGTSSSSQELVKEDDELEGDDSIRYTPVYILQHPIQTFRLCVHSVVVWGEHYVRTLVGGALGYFGRNRELAVSWSWVILLYLLLGLAWLCPNGKTMPLSGRTVCLLAGLAACALTVAACVTWTPTYYTAIYGLQGRYFLPVLPLLLLARPKALTLSSDCSRGLVFSVGLVDLCVLLNAFLSVVAR